MNMRSNFFMGTVSIVLVLVGAVIIAGCTSPATPATPPQQTTVPAPVMTEQTVIQTPVPAATTTTSQPAMTAVSLSNDVTLSYPSGWNLEQPQVTAMRDYGRTTINIANFFSPVAPGVLSPELDPDGHPYTTISIDVDPQPVSDNEHYFNVASAAVLTTYGEVTITQTTQTGLKGIDECSLSKAVCKDYNLEFKSKTIERWYHFVAVDGTFYIVTINNPTLNFPEVYEILKSTKITTDQSVVRQR